jgi:HK97 family phage portal protein
VSALTFLGSAWRSLTNRTLAPEPQVTTARVRTGGRSPAGVYVSPDTALKNPVVWACCQYLTKTVAQLPWRVMLDSAQGSVRAKTNPVDWLLGQRPCPDMGSFNWRVSMLLNALLWGNGYAEIERDNRGAVYALWPIHPERVGVRRNESGELEYEVWNRSGTTVLAAADMFHLRGFGDGPLGYGIIDYAAQSIGWAQATELFSAAYFGSGANPTGVVETNGKPLSPEGMELLKADFNRLYAGPKGEQDRLPRQWLTPTRRSRSTPRMGSSSRPCSTRWRISAAGSACRRTR